MKRNVFDQILVAPNVIPAQSLTTAAGTGGIIDRREYLSLRLGIYIKNTSGAGTLHLGLTTSDDQTDDSSFVPVDDVLIGLNGVTKQERDASETLTSTVVVLPFDGDGLYQVDLDVIGSKGYVKIVPWAESSATCDIEVAAALGDIDTSEPVS